MRKLNVRTSVRKLATATALAAALGSMGGLGSSLTTAHVAGADTGNTNYVFQDDFGAISVVGGPENNDITVTLTAGHWTITDNAHSLTTWSPCESLDANTVTCKAVPGTDRATIFGLDGDDTLRGGTQSDTIHGGNGIDHLLGFGGTDSLFGDADIDVLMGGTGIDYLDGGAGRDQVQYWDSAWVKVDLTNQVATVGEFVSTTTDVVTTTDKLASIDDVVGSRGPDLLLGHKGSNSFVPLEGNDTVYGGPGRDKVKLNWSYAPVKVNLALGRATGQGKDKLKGVEDAVGSLGSDTIIGSNGPNELAGRTGNDRIYGRGGNDRLFGEEGNDYLNGGGGSDLLDGGAGSNTTIQ
jgi:Ca2+-binding RTX toxin-like protein